MQSVLRSLLSPDILLQVVEKSGVHSVCVKETGADAKLKKLEITGLSPNDLAFSLDHQPSGRMSTCFKQLSCYLNVTHDKINKGCDFALLCKYQGQLTLILGEMKSSKPKASEVSLQLKNSDLFMNYVLSLANEWHDAREALRIRKVCVHCGKPMAQKRPAKRRPEGPSDPKTIKFYSVKAPEGRISLNQLFS